MKARRVRVALPRPKGTRASSRVELSITMHPRELRELEARASSRSMSLTAYVRALLESDADDVAPAPRRTFSLAELASDSELVGAGALHVQLARPPAAVRASSELADARTVALTVGVPLVDDEDQPRCVERRCAAPRYVWPDGKVSTMCARHTRASLERGE